MVRAVFTGPEAHHTMSVQPCPNCGERNDVSIFVHGQWTRCQRCGIRFAVLRGGGGVVERPTPPPPASARGQAPARAAGEPTVIAPAPFVDTDAGSGASDPSPPDAMESDPTPSRRVDSDDADRTSVPAPPVDHRDVSEAVADEGTFRGPDVVEDAPPPAGHTALFDPSDAARTPTPVLLAGVAGDEPAWLPASGSLPESAAPPSPGSVPEDSGPPGNAAPLTSDLLFPTPAQRRTPRQETPPPAPAARAQTPAAPRIPGYDCETLLGRGGMGEVWKARQLSLQRPVAIKLLSPTLAVEPDFVRRFERESNALAALAHPHVVTIFDRGSADGTWYFVMELVEGGSLRDRLSDRATSKRERLRLLAQVARAIDYAHQCGVIHRDLKPENVLVDRAGNARVADFGLAGMSEIGRSELTMTAVAMGTAHYMAPEQRRDAKHVDGRADLYSLGVMLYEALTGELPVGRFPSPREKDRDIDPRLDAMVLRLLDPEPDRRPSRGSEIALLLETVLAESADLPEAPAPVQPRRSPLSSMLEATKGRPVARWMLGLTVVLLLAIVTVALRSADDAPSVEPVRIAAAVDRKGDRAEVRFGEGQPEAVLAVSGGWSFDAGALTRNAGTHAPTREPRAVLESLELDLSNAALEVDVVVDTIPGAAEPPKAELILYFDAETNVGIRLGLEEDRGFALFSTTPVKGQPVSRTLPGSGVADPQAGTSLRLAVMTVNGRATALVDGRQIASTPVSGLSGIKARAALGCRGAICRFSGLRMSGKLVEPVLQAEAQ